jgi:hypothetical protein
MLYDYMYLLKVNYQYLVYNYCNIIFLLISIKCLEILVLCAKLCLIYVKNELSPITLHSDDDIDKPYERSDNWERNLRINREYSSQDFYWSNSYVYITEIGGFFVRMSRVPNYDNPFYVFLNKPK